MAESLEDFADRRPRLRVLAVVIGVVSVLLVGLGIAIGVYFMAFPRLWVEQGYLISADNDATLCACISLDDQFIASGGSDAKIRIWDANTGDLHVGRARTDGPVKSLAYSTDGKLLFAGLTDRVRFSQPSGFPIGAYTVFQGSQTTSLAASSDGLHLAATDSSGAVNLYEAKQPARYLQDQQLGSANFDVALSGVIFAPDSSHFAVFGEDGLLALRNVPECDPRASLEGHEKTVTAAAFSPDGDTLYSVDEGGELRCWNVKDAELIGSCRVSDQGASAILTTPDGATLLVGDDRGDISAWNAKTLARELLIEAHNDRVTSLDFSHEGDWFVSSGADGWLKIWHLRSGSR